MATLQVHNILSRALIETDFNQAVPRSLGFTLEDQVIAATRDILLDFIDRSGIASQFAYAPVSNELEDTFYVLIRSYDLGISEKQLKKYGTIGLNMAAIAYGHVPFAVQISIALYTALGIILDDDDILTTHVIREFPPRLFDGRPQLHAVLTHWVQTIVDMREQFPPYSANIITTNAVDFVSAEMLVRDESQGGPDGKAEGYADYMRLKNGLGEAYAAFIWPLEMFPQAKTYVQTFPHVAQWASFANDLLSFYKEYKDGETDNYMSQLAISNGQTQSQTLRNVAEKLVAIDRRIKNILGSGGERHAWESFTAGYVEFHLRTPRYRLEELLPEYCLKK